MLGHGLDACTVLEQFRKPMLNLIQGSEHIYAQHEHVPVLFR